MLSFVSLGHELGSTSVAEVLEAILGLYPAICLFVLMVATDSRDVCSVGVDHGPGGACRSIEIGFLLGWAVKGKDIFGLVMLGTDERFVVWLKVIGEMVFFLGMEVEIHALEGG